MISYVFAISVICIFGAVSFIDYIFKTCMFFPYLKLLHDAGISISLFFIRWETSQLNRLLLQFANRYRVFLRKWFEVGAVLVSLCCLPSLLFILCSCVYSNFKSQKEAAAIPAMMPVIPGVNLPDTHIFHYLTAIFISMLVHEFGHALAASREKVCIESCGIGLFACVPLAFVRLPLEQLKQSSLQQQRRVYAAGVWHNIVTAFLAFLLLRFHSVLLQPVYQRGTGVTVLSVEQGSGASQPGGLVAGDHILSVNNCTVKYVDGWIRCLEQSVLEPQRGFCVSNEFIKLNNIISEVPSSMKCCPETSQSHACFNYSSNQIYKLACLPARKIFESGNMCSTNAQCQNQLCAFPEFTYKQDRLLKIQRKSKPPVLYLGSVEELYRTVLVTPWVSPNRFLPSVSIVHWLDTFLKYLIMFSLGLAIMNVIPCYWFDGQYLAETFVFLYLPETMKIEYRLRILSALKLFGLIVICFTFYTGLKQLSSQNNHVLLFM